MEQAGFKDITQPSTPTGNVNSLENNPSAQPENLTPVLKTIQVGDAGNKSFKVDNRGMSIGGKDFDTAPFTVDMDGNMKFDKQTVDGSLAISEAGIEMSDGNDVRLFIGPI